MVNKGVIRMPAFLVEEALDGITVQHFLRRHCQVSARLLAKLKRTENGMTVNGQPVRSIDILHGGDVIELIFPQDNADIQPVLYFVRAAHGGGGDLTQREAGQWMCCSGSRGSGSSSRSSPRC